MIARLVPNVGPRIKHNYELNLSRRDWVVGWEWQCGNKKFVSKFWVKRMKKCFDRFWLAQINQKLDINGIDHNNLHFYKQLKIENVPNRSQSACLTRFWARAVANLRVECGKRTRPVNAKNTLDIWDNDSEKELVAYQNVISSSLFWKHFT